MPELLSESSPVARKLHRCGTCTGVIEAGQRYVRASLVHDGRVYDWVTCHACDDDAVTNRVCLWAHSWDEGATPEMAHEWATEAVIHGSQIDQRVAKDFLERWGTS